MAGFFLINNKTEYCKSTVLDRFSSLNYNSPKEFKLNGYDLYLFPKNSVSKTNYYLCDNGFICGVGTFIYKGLVYEQALPIILNDYINKTIDYDSFIGEYLIYLQVEEQNVILRDGSCLKRLYSIDGIDVLSTSFDALIPIGGDKNYDLMSVLELLHTGLICGNDTIIKEIKRISFCANYNRVKIIQVEQPKDEVKDCSKDEVVLLHKNKIENYFEYINSSFNRYCSDNTFDIGLTAGLDSRILIAAAHKKLESYKIHTHWRKEGDKNIDYRCAHLIAKHLNVDITSIPSTDMFNTIELCFEAGYNSCDGVIRPGCYWDEIYPTLEYRSKITKYPYVRLLGFGGEQYRNADHYPNTSKRSLRNWIKWDLLFAFMNTHLLDDKTQENLINHIEDKLNKSLDCPRSFALKEYKRYVKIEQSTSYRAIQTNIENRIGFALNPFMDINLVNSTIDYSHCLGDSMFMQLELIKQMSSSIAKIDNDYGFNFIDGEPLKNRALAFVWKLSPANLRFNLKRTLNRKKRLYKDIISNPNNESYYLMLIDQVKKLNLPIDIYNYITKNTRSKLLLNLGYFIMKNEKYIKTEK